jgi:amidase
MPITPPTSEHIRRAADAYGMTFAERDIEELRESVAAAMELVSAMDELSDATPAPSYPRTAGERPLAEDNPLNAWYVRTSVKGAATGRLAGRRVVLKDNICLAGVPMMVGSSTLEGYVPEVDATVVTRILDAGGEIVGKAHCEYFCFGGGSHTCAAGPVHNPHRHGYSAGGSSSGCAALVGAGTVEMAIGGDQGGSIRQPSALCGVYGMKPTHGLVPYTGAFPVDHTLDHLGPMTTTVEANALLLEVIAGPDGLDSRQRSPEPAAYTEALGLGVEGMRIGLLVEGFGRDGGMPEVDVAVRKLAGRLADRGAVISEVSVPMHGPAVSVWAAIAIEGTAMLAMRDNGVGIGHPDRTVLSMIAAHAGWRHKSDMLSEPLKAGLIAGHYLHERYQGTYYAKAQNLVGSVRRAYDDMFEHVDLLLMPTMPYTAPPLPAGHSRAEQSSPGFAPVVNTAPFNVTGHPAMSVPAGMIDGLPVAGMLVGRRWDEFSIYRAASAVEVSGEWRDWQSSSTMVH